MDGVIDAAACELGDGLYLDEQNGWLYVATDRPVPDDAFLYVAADPSQAQPANWAKAGSVGEWDFFLAREGSGSNSFAAWFDASGTSPIADDAARYVHARNGDVLEGAILKSLAGGSRTWVALGLYGTDDGGGLVAQVPASLDANGNIDATEFHAVYTGSEPCSGLPPVRDTWMFY
jgi:hypothetical protein